MTHLFARGGVLTARPGVAKAGHLFGGPYLKLEPGHYRVDFSLRGIGAPGQGQFGFLEVYDFASNTFRARQELQEAEVPPTDGFVRHSLEFDIPPGDNKTELRVWWSGNGAVEAGQIALTRTA